MSTPNNLIDESSQLLKTTIERFCIVVIFSIAFAYIESAVVVYLRAIFHPDGFAFPLSLFGAGPNWKRYLITEIGREAATIVLIFTAAWLFGQNRRQRFAYFLTIFAIWDIFYYVWLKVLLNWPASIMDWDILFLIPITWASAVLYPVLISILMLISAATILYRDVQDKPIEVKLTDWLAFFIACVIVVVSFCTPGPYITEPGYEAHFYPPLFALGYLTAIAVFLKCLLKSK